MQRPDHLAAKAAASRLTPERIVGIGFVGLLHILLVWALVSGLAVRFVKTLPAVLQAQVIAPSQPKPDIAPPLPKLETPAVVPTPTVVPPEIDIQTQQASPIVVSANPTNPDGAVKGLMSTHTTPPYPANARRLEQQGVVMLRLTISPQGDIVHADILHSSGYPELDQTAVSWVVAHWKYKPAIQNGVAVTSMTNANVRFDLTKG